MSFKSDVVFLGLVGAGLYFIYKKGSDFFGGLGGSGGSSFDIGFPKIKFPDWFGGGDDALIPNRMPTIREGSFIDTVRDWYNGDGSGNTRQELPGEVAEYLKNKYPRRYNWNLPIEQEIKTESLLGEISGFQGIVNENMDGYVNTSSGSVSLIGSVLNPGDGGYLAKYDYRLNDSASGIKNTGNTGGRYGDAFGN